MSSHEKSKRKPHPITNHLSLTLSRGEGTEQLISFFMSNKGFNIFLKEIIINILIYKLQIFLTLKFSLNAHILPFGKGWGGV
jgi:hypothetical protein